MADPAFAAALRDRYLLERELGRGGMAAVYLARDLKHDRLVALKVLHPELARALGADRFLREIRIAAQLQHAHILPLFDSGTADGLPYYAMPYVEGHSLRVWIERERQLGLEEALRITREVAAALTHAHAHGIVHRDIKPENILLTRDGQALVADFGIAQAAEAAGGEKLTETGLSLGTPAYMSPEQAGGGHLDGRSDLYALGCVLYEMLAGQPPFTGRTAQSVLARHAVDPVPSLRTVRSTVPRSVERAITKALAKVPADRFATAGEFSTALNAGSGTESEVAETSSTVETSTTGHKKSRRLVAAGTGLAVVAAIGLASALGRKTTELEANRVLVVPFENRTGDSTLDPLGDIAVDYVAGGLRVTGGVEEVVDARSQGVSGAAKRLSASSGRAMGRKAGAGKIVLGAYDAAPGDSLQFQAQVLDTRSGRVLRLIGPVSAPAKARLAALQDVRTRVMAGVATLFDWDFSEETSLPATYEVLQEWKVAVEAGWCHDRQPGCRERAVEQYYRVAEMDSNFTLPLTHVAYGSYASNCARVDSIASRLRPRVGRLPPVDGVQLRIATSICHGDLAGALDAAHGGVEGAPNNRLLPSLEALMLLFSNRPREVLGILEPVDMTQALDPPQDIAVLLGAYHRLGMYAGALAYIAKVRQIKPNTNADMRHLYLREETASLAALGRVAEIGKQLNEAVRQLGPEERGLAVAYMMEQTGQELAAHGHSAEARQVFDRGIAWVRTQQGEHSGHDHRRALAGLLNSAGRWNEALALYRTLAIEDSSDTDMQAALGDLAARRGDRAEAIRIDRLLSARAATDPAGATGEYWLLYQRARMAGLLGERERAISLLREAAQKGFTGWRVAHLDPDLAPMRDDPAFQEWIRPKD